MLFNSYEFLFAFLPLALLGYRMLSGRAARAWLVVCSLYFYAWWSPPYLALLLFSIGFNYALGRAVEPDAAPEARRRLVLGLGVATNLALLGWFKYANFFADTLNRAFSTSFSPGAIVLPLAISFFTFQQIAYLVDSFRGQTREHRFLDYCLFVTFFPQLIAGPIVHHREMLPQFERPRRGIADHLAVGGTIFVIGLFKKVLIADSIAAYATPVFDQALGGAPIGFAQAWTGTLAYTLQLYFDFSGYSDMAIGLGRMFGILLPLNFDSPYKAASAIDFWRRWHMTLSRFLRDYLYIALGGNRKGRARRYANLLLTMLLGGLWHGAAWTFVAWGALHGLYLVVNHAWRALRCRLGWGPRRSHWWSRGVARALTFLAAAVAWVFFRAESFGAAGRVLTGLAGLSGPGELAASTLEAALWIAPLLAIVFFAPNTQQLMRDHRPAVDFDGERGAAVPDWLAWRPQPVHAALLALVTVAAVVGMSRVSEFLYYQF